MRATPCPTRRRKRDPGSPARPRPRAPSRRSQGPPSSCGGRLTQPILKDDFERLSGVLGAGVANGASAAEDDESTDWPGAWISLRIEIRGVRRTRFSWALLEEGTNDVAFTSADAGVSAAGPPPSASDTPVQADVWVPFPARSGRYVVAVYLLPEAGQRLDEYVSPPFMVASRPGSGAPAPAPSPAPPDAAFDDGPSDAGQPAPPSAPSPAPEPSPSPPDDLPEIDVPGPIYSAPVIR